MFLVSMLLFVVMNVGVLVIGFSVRNVLFVMVFGIVMCDSWYGWLVYLSVMIELNE